MISENSCSDEFVIETPEVYTANWTSFVSTAVTVICDVTIPAEALYSADLDHAICVVRILWQTMI